ncbi:MAG: hypothetical protein QOH04_2418 [Sphingomonadales bacterium]|nr:hypothetical protein [Sphingomonadales bacterium]
MAAPALSTTRRTLLGAAAGLLPAIALGEGGSRPSLVRPEPVEGPVYPSSADRTLWNNRLARYRRLAARAKAAAETGWFRAANDRYYRACADPTADRKTAFARVNRAEDQFWRRCTAPLQQAAVALVLTPAPDLEALRVKLAVIRAHQLHEEGSMSRDCFEVLERDVDRLCS